MASPPLGGQQHVAAEVEEPCQLVAASAHFRGSGPRHRGQVAGHEAHREERDQRRPVLRIRDDERADGRQEEVVEGEHCGE